MASLVDWDTCSICCEKYDMAARIPKSLDCRHTFCADCITQHSKRQLKCPKCRKPMQDASRLPSDLTMIDYMEQTQQTDYNKVQRRMREELENVKEELEKRAVAIKKEMDSKESQRDEYLSDQSQLCKAHLERDFANAARAMDEQTLLGKVLVRSLREGREKVDKFTRQLSVVNTALEEKHIRTDAYEDSLDKFAQYKRDHEANAETDMYYDSYSKAFFFQFRLLIGLGDDEVNQAEARMSQMNITPSRASGTATEESSPIDNRGAVSNSRTPRSYKSITRPQRILAYSGVSPGAFDMPTGVAVLANGNLLVTEQTNNRIQIITINGESVLLIGSEGSEPGQLKNPRRAVLNEEGNIVVCDKFNNRLQEFSPSGQFLKATGKYGMDLGSLCTPRDVAIDSKGNMYVPEGSAEQQHSRIQVFDKARGFSWDFGQDYLSKPLGIAIRDDKVAVCDSQTNKCEMFQTDGAHLMTLCSPGSAPGEVMQPQGIAFDPEGNIIVADWGNRRIQILKSDGELIHIIAQKWEKEAGKEFSPCGVAVTADGRLVVSDANHNKIYIF